MVEWQIVKGYLKEHEKNTYVYAYEILLNQIINIFAATVLSIISGKEMEVAVFLVVYIPIRKYAGGFHAKTNGRCILYSIIMIYCVITINKLFQNFIFDIGVFCGALTLIFLICVWLISPVESLNKKLSLDEKNFCEGKVHLFCVIDILLLFLNLFVLKKMYISISLLLAYTILLLLLVLGKIHKFER